MELFISYSISLSLSLSVCLSLSLSLSLPLSLSLSLSLALSLSLLVWRKLFKLAASTEARACPGPRKDLQALGALPLLFPICIVSRPLASRGAPERHVYCCWLRVRNGLFLIRNQVYYTRTPSGGTLGACATRQGGVGGGRASSPERLAARSRGVKRVALRHSRAGGMAVGRSRL